MKSARVTLGLVTLAIALGAQPAVARQGPAEPGPRYVALGSSFAAGPGIAPYEDGAPRVCARSTRNYAHQLAQRRGLQLVDVSCSGATTQAILQPWLKQPAQIDAVDAATRLVTVTIGGNDLNYLGRMIAASCRRRAGQDARAMARCPVFPSPTQPDYARLAASLDQIAQGVKTRAPNARLVFVAYPAILPKSGACDAAPMLPADADALRETARGLAKVTAKAARRNGALFVDAPRLSRHHDACADAPWVAGFVTPDAPYHPNLAGMTGLAAALDRQLPR